ncbi:MAG TPA: TRAP transporter substrate-binding protein DctP [Tetragenococcus sp.]|nr:TRAP transporter substrate-binding protein DctP [Tetragenococcus sp.]
MKKIVSVLMVCSIILSACGSDNKGSGTTSDDDVIKLKFADYMPKSHFSSENAQQVWVDKVNELTDGKVEIEYYPSEQLGKAADSLDLVNTGVADIVNVPQAYVSGKMPLSSVVSLPGLVEETEQGSLASFELIKSEPVLENDFIANDVVPVFAYTTSPYEFFSVKKPIENLADLKGMKVRSQGGSANLQIEALGATPVTISTAEQYEALERGTIDTTLSALTSVSSYKLDEVVKYATSGAGGGTTLVFYLMDKEKWDSIPEDLQDKINQATEEILADFIEKSMEYDEEIKENLADEGIEFSELNQSEFSEANEEVKDKWIEENKEKSRPAQETIDKFEDLLDEYK